MKPLLEIRFSLYRYLKCVNDVTNGKCSVTLIKSK